MSELRDLYQEVILDHSKAPRNFHSLPGANHHAEGVNPLCGDRIQIWVKVEDGVIRDASFEGAGCAISRASASMMTATLKGKTLEEARDLFENFHLLVTRGEGTCPAEALGKLVVFCGVSEFPARVKCATLAWHTLRAALKDESEPVSTE